MKQYHVHTLNSKGERVPLTHCRRSDNPKLCKGDFPRTMWLIDKAVLLCQGLMKRMHMPCGGRRNRLGSFQGPQNDENLNGSHPALLAGLQCNSDVQLPYRFVIDETTHDNTECSEQCWKLANVKDLTEIIQTCQDAQTGYTCDYQNKRNPIAVHESRE